MSEGGRDQGRKHQERKPIISDAFSLQKEFVLEAFKNLNPRKDSVSVKAAADEESRILGRNNPYALISFGNVLEYYTEDVAAQLRRGNLICYKALRLGGELPTFTEQFVQRYDEEQDEQVERELHELQLEPYQGALLRRKSNIDIFREFEPENSRIIERKLRVGSGWLPEEDDVYRGIIDLYFLFRKGCSDPKNFAKNLHE